MRSCLADAVAMKASRKEMEDESPLVSVVKTIVWYSVSCHLVQRQRVDKV
jgi:hypothetical protein